jgi:hypothetical protein
MISDCFAFKAVADEVRVWSSVGPTYGRKSHAMVGRWASARESDDGEMTQVGVWVGVRNLFTIGKGNGL